MVRYRGRSWMGCRLSKLASGIDDELEILLPAGYKLGHHEVVRFQAETAAGLGVGSVEDDDPIGPFLAGTG
jgi:hypothetical protein